MSKKLRNKSNLVEEAESILDDSKTVMRNY